MARSALIEGDASSVMTDYTRKLTMGVPLREDANIDSILLENISGAMLSTSLSKAPPALHALLFFPYVSGIRFAHGLLRESGYEGIDRAFKHLPESCEEILHPEKYKADKKDFNELEPFIPSGLKAKVVYDDRLGEFIISAMLGGFISPGEASQAAAGWGGDKVAVLKSKEREVITWNTAWDSEVDAKEFFQATILAYTKRFGEPLKKTTSEVNFKNNLREVLIKQNNNFVVLAY